MDILLPSVFIFALTALLILALNARARRRAHYKEINFVYEEESWRIEFGRARYGAILHTFARVRSNRIGNFCPQIAHKIIKNGRIINSVPNFWRQSTGWCVAGKHSNVVMAVEIVFRDLLMARAFAQRLLGADFYSNDVTMLHNKVVLRINLF